MYFFLVSADFSPQRSSRQIIFKAPLLQGYQPLLFGNVDHFSTALIAAGPCFDNKGILGKCMPFRKCYPYFKLPELNNWDTWVLGMYDTCSYYTAQGRQVICLFLYLK